LDPCLRLSLVRQCPAAQDSTVRPQVRETLVRGEAHGGFRTLLDCTPFAAQLRDHGSEHQGKTQAEGVPHLLRQRQRGVAAHQPLVRIAQIPQRQSSVEWVSAASAAPRRNNVAPTARCPATRLAESWACCAKVKSCSPSASAVWCSART